MSDNECNFEAIQITELFVVFQMLSGGSTSYKDAIGKRAFFRRCTQSTGFTSLQSIVPISSFLSCLFGSHKEDDFYILKHVKALRHKLGRFLSEV